MMENEEYRDFVTQTPSYGYNEQDDIEFVDLEDDFGIGNLTQSSQSVVGSMQYSDIWDDENGEVTTMNVVEEPNFE